MGSLMIIGYCLHPALLAPGMAFNYSASILKKPDSCSSCTLSVLMEDLVNVETAEDLATLLGCTTRNHRTDSMPSTYHPHCKYMRRSPVQSSPVRTKSRSGYLQVRDPCSFSHSKSASTSLQVPESWAFQIPMSCLHVNAFGGDIALFLVAADFHKLLDFSFWFKCWTSTHRAVVHA